MSTRPTFAELFEGVRDLAIHLSFTVQIWEQMYVGNGNEADSRARLVAHRNFPGLLTHLKRVLIDSAFLDIAKLADCDTRTLSVSNLLNAMKREPAGRFRNREGIRAEGAAFLRLARIINLHRNRRIAHNDSAVRFDPAEALPQMKITEFREAVASAFRVLNLIQADLGDGETGYAHSFFEGGDGRTLCRLISRADRSYAVERYLWAIDMHTASVAVVRDEVLRLLGNE